MTRIAYAALARRDLERIDRYHREIDAELASTISERIVAAVRLLQDNPYAGPETSRAQRRKWRVAGTRYIIFYRVTASELRVVHGVQRAAAP